MGRKGTKEEKETYTYTAVKLNYVLIRRSTSAAEMSPKELLMDTASVWTISVLSNSSGAKATKASPVVVFSLIISATVSGKTVLSGPTFSVVGNSPKVNE